MKYLEPIKVFYARQKPHATDQAHTYFDKLWKLKLFTRAEAYE